MLMEPQLFVLAATSIGFSLSGKIRSKYTDSKELLLLGNGGKKGWLASSELRLGVIGYLA